ncbi:hypothetical protein [Oceanobacillus oncorhynchi]|uniref:hypothetical protein n=1 Tax=Oceanobacillus oncorhynchi TaxID=545501 RepID=UPI0034D6F22E
MDERLDEISKRARVELVEIPRGYTVKKVTLSDYDYEYILQQAEKVQELEKENKELLEAGKFFADGYHQYEEENRRYKEDLEQLRKDVSREGKYGGWIPKQVSYDIDDQIEDALKGESE